jgi:DNA-binding MarR family transcriptional regulator
MPPETDTLAYRALADFRYHLRRFLHSSEEAAREAGLEPQQHQLLLAIKGLPADDLATITRLAERLQLRHHSVVGLVDRLAAAGLVHRRRDGMDQRRVLIELTAAGEAILERLSRFHERELRLLAPALIASLEAITPAGGGAGPQSRASSARAGAP